MLLHPILLFRSLILGLPEPAFLFSEPFFCMAGAVYRFGSRSGGIGAGLRQYTPEGYASIPWEYCSIP